MRSIDAHMLWAENPNIRAITIARVQRTRAEFKRGLITYAELRQELLELRWNMRVIAARFGR